MNEQLTKECRDKEFNLTSVSIRNVRKTQVKVPQ